MFLWPTGTYIVRPVGACHIWWLPFMRTGIQPERFNTRTLSTDFISLATCLVQHT